MAKQNGVQMIARIAATDCGTFRVYVKYPSSVQTWTADTYSNALKSIATNITQEAWADDISMIPHPTNK